MDDCSISSKTCSRCGKVLPLDVFIRDRRKPDGHGSACRACDNARKAAWIAAHPERHRAACKKWEARHLEGQREYRRRWQQEHAEQERERHRRTRAANPEHHREKVRRSYQKHADKRRAESAAYHREHAARLREQDRRRRKMQGDAYLLSVREYHARRRFKRYPVPVEPVSYQAILDRDGYHCHICNQPIEPACIKAVEFDHIIPPQHGGSHTFDNIAVAHCHCNKKKWRNLLVVPA